MTFLPLLSLDLRLDMANRNKGQRTEVKVRMANWGDQREVGESAASGSCPVEVKKEGP